MWLQVFIPFQQLSKVKVQSSSLPYSQQAATNSLMLQREASALAGQSVQPSQSQAAAAVAAQQQPKWPAGGASTAVVSSEQLSLELHQVEREIGKRTREMALVRDWGGNVAWLAERSWDGGMFVRRHLRTPTWV